MLLEEKRGQVKSLELKVDRLMEETKVWSGQMHGQRQRGRERERSRERKRDLHPPRHARTHTRTHAHTHTRTRTRTRTHTYACRCSPVYQVLREEYQQLETDSKSRIARLRSDLDDAALKISAFNKLEQVWH